MLRSACKTDRGVTRTVNEDAFLCLEDIGFFMLADGVGGHNSGEVASNLAVEATRDYLASKPLDDVESAKIFLYLYDCLKKTNETICARAKSRPDYLGMATTSIILVVRDQQAYIANVGDSRAYLLKDDEFTGITEDHTYVNELLRDGKISEDEAKVHPKRNVITRALGCEEPISPDFYRIELAEGDRILLCTDGLYNEVDEENLEAYMRQVKDLDLLVDKLVQEACLNGGKDNITVACVDIVDDVRRKI